MPGRVEGEEQDGARDLLGRADPPHRRDRLALALEGRPLLGRAAGGAPTQLTRDAGIAS